MTLQCPAIFLNNNHITQFVKGIPSKKRRLVLYGSQPPGLYDCRCIRQWASSELSKQQITKMTHEDAGEDGRFRPFSQWFSWCPMMMSLQLSQLTTILSFVPSMPHSRISRHSRLRTIRFLEMETAMGNELLQLSGTVAALGKRSVGEFLYRLLNLSTFLAFIFIDRHFPSSPRTCARAHQIRRFNIPVT